MWKRIVLERCSSGMTREKGAKASEKKGGKVGNLWKNLWNEAGDREKRERLVEDKCAMKIVSKSEDLRRKENIRE